MASSPQTTSPDGALALSGPQELLWRSTMRVLVELPRALEADLARDSALTLMKYAALVALSEAGERGLRMSELAGHANLSASRITRLVDELRREGLVVKARAGDDGRGNVAVLTPAGLQRLQAAYPAHLRSVRRHYIDPLADLLGDTRAAELGAVLEALANTLRPLRGGCPPAACPQRAC